MTAQSAARGRGGGERWPHIIVRSTICPCKYVVLCWTSPHRGTDGCASPNCANKQVVFETCMAQCTRADYTPVGIIFSVSLCSCKLYAYTSQKLTHKSTTHLNCTVYTILANLRQSTPWELPTLHSVTSYMYVGILYTHAVDYNCTRSVCRKISIYVFNTCTYVIVLHNAEWCTGRDETNEGQLSHGKRRWGQCWRACINFIRIKLELQNKALIFTCPSEVKRSFFQCSKER